MLDGEAVYQRLLQCKRSTGAGTRESQGSLWVKGDLERVKRADRGLKRPFNTSLVLQMTHHSPLIWLIIEQN